MTIAREQIAALIPHAGDMVQLDRVVSCEDKWILCETWYHLNPANPLRRHGRLLSINGVEIGAQAAALHGAMLQGRKAASGMLVLIRNVDWSRDRLDDLTASLRVRAECRHISDLQVGYRIAIECEDVPLISGEIGVIFL